MKSQFCLAAGAAGLLLLAFLPSSLAIDRGDTLETVVAELGEPVASIRIDDVRVFYYERGRVEVTHGEVTAADLISEEAAAERERRRKEEEAAWRAQQAERYEAGKQALERRLVDESFLALPAERRVAAWESFKRTYPGVPLPDDYYQALRERTVEREEERTQRRIAELERQVREAEARADRRASTPEVYSSGFYGHYHASYGYTFPSTVVTVRGIHPAHRVRDLRHGYHRVKPYHVPSHVRRRVAPKEQPLPSVAPRTSGFGYQEPLGRPSSRIYGHPYRSSRIGSSSIRRGYSRGGSCTRLGSFVR